MLRASEKAIDAADLVARLQDGNVVLTKNRFGQTRAFAPSEWLGFLDRTAKNAGRPIALVWTEESLT